MIRILTAVFVTFCVNLAACGSGDDTPIQEYELEGWVVAVHEAQGQVTIKHLEIPGYMGPMTMPFTVKDEWAFKALEPGRYVQAPLVVQGDRSWLQDLTISDGPPDESAPGAVGDKEGPPPGDPVPDYALINQDGERVRLQQYRGKALLLTFIYTRCPIPEYCPRMSLNFAEIHRELRSDPKLRSKAHLLSVSFDSDFDTPQVMRRYGAGYVFEEDDNPFENWEFVSGSADEIRKMADYFGLSYWPESGQIIHSLRTALIAPDGSLVRLYRGNEWTPKQVLQELKAQLDG